MTDIGRFRTAGEWADHQGYMRYMMEAQVNMPCEWCKERAATHAGFANGLVLTPALCDQCATRWVNQGKIQNLR